MVKRNEFVAVVFLFIVSASSGFADERFKAASIKGDYGFTCTGTVNGSPFAGIGQLYCDGRSTCSGAGTLNPNGISLPLHIDFVVMSNGNEIRGIPTESGYIVTCELARQ